MCQPQFKGPGGSFGSWPWYRRRERFHHWRNSAGQPSPRLKRILGAVHFLGLLCVLGCALQLSTVSQQPRYETWQPPKEKPVFVSGRPIPVEFSWLLNWSFSPSFFPLTPSFFLFFPAPRLYPGTTSFWSDTASVLSCLPSEPGGQVTPSSREPRFPYPSLTRRFPEERSAELNYFYLVLCTRNLEMIPMVH